MDATWNDPVGGIPVYNYFMKAEMDFADHERASEYKTADFHAQYPMAAVSYGEIEQEALDKANLSYTFKGIDGESPSAAVNGKPKLLIFFSVDCGKSQFTLEDFSKSNWIKTGDVDVYAIDTKKSTAERVRSFQKEYCSEGYIKFGYAEDSSASSAMWSYARECWFGNSISWSLIVMIDSSNRFSDVKSGQYYSKAVIWAYSQGIVSGYMDGSYGINDSITREQIVKMPTQFIKKYR